MKQETLEALIHSTYLEVIELERDDTGKRWELYGRHRGGGRTARLQTARGDVRTFASLDTAENYLRALKYRGPIVIL